MHNATAAAAMLAAFPAAKLARDLCSPFDSALKLLAEPGRKRAIALAMLLPAGAQFIEGPCDLINALRNLLDRTVRARALEEAEVLPTKDARDQLPLPPRRSLGLPATGRTVSIGRIASIHPARCGTRPVRAPSGAR